MLWTFLNSRNILYWLNFNHKKKKKMTHPKNNTLPVGIEPTTSMLWSRHTHHLAMPALIHLLFKNDLHKSFGTSATIVAPNMSDTALKSAVSHLSDGVFGFEVHDGHALRNLCLFKNPFQFFLKYQKFAVNQISGHFGAKRLKII